MIPTIFFIIVTLVIIGCGLYYFLINDRGPVPYADMLSCVIGFFLSVFVAIQAAAGNIGDKALSVLTNTTMDFQDNTYVSNSVPDITNLTVIDPAIAWFFVGAAVLFVVCAVYSIVTMVKQYKYERSM